MLALTLSAFLGICFQARGMGSLSRSMPSSTAFLALGAVKTCSRQRTGIQSSAVSLSIPFHSLSGSLEVVLFVPQSTDNIASDLFSKLSAIVKQSPLGLAAV